MKGFKNTTRTQYSMGGDVGGYAKGGTAKPAMAKASKPAVAKAAKPAMAKDAKPAMGKAPVKKNEGGKMGKMPPIGESVKSGNRASKMTAAEMRDMEKRFSDKKRPSPADSAKSANRVSSQEAAEARHLGVFKNGGKVAKYADGGPVGQPQPMGQKPGGMPAVQPLGGPVGAQPQMGGQQAQLPDYYSQFAQQLGQQGGYGQQPPMGQMPQQQVTDMQQLFGGLTPAQMMARQQQAMGGQQGFSGALNGIGINIPQPPSMGVIDNRIDSGNFGRPMQPSGGSFQGMDQQLLQALQQMRSMPQQPNANATPSRGLLGNLRPPSPQEQQRQARLEQVRQRVMSRGMARGEEDGRDAPMQQQAAAGPERPKQVMPPTKQPLPSPKMPPTKQPLPPSPMKGPGTPRIGYGSTDPRFKTGGLATMPKKGKC